MNAARALLAALRGAAGLTGLEAARQEAETTLAAHGEEEDAGGTEDPMEKYGWLFGTAQTGGGTGSSHGSAGVGAGKTSREEGDVDQEVLATIEEILDELQRLAPDLTAADIGEARGLLITFHRQNPGFDLGVYREFMDEYRQIKPDAFDNIDVKKLKKELYRLKGMYPNFNAGNLRTMIEKYQRLKSLKDQYQ